MSKTNAILLFGQVIGLSSTVFMLYVFLNEAFYKHYVLFYENNIAIATMEFFVCLAGLLVQIVVAFIFVWKPATGKPKENKERTGYETGNKRAYQ